MESISANGTKASFEAPVSNHVPQPERTRVVRTTSAQQLMHQKLYPMVLNSFLT